MNALAKASLGLVAALLIVAAPAGPVASEGLSSSGSTSPTAPPTTAPLRFGMDAGSVAAQAAAGAKPDYGTLWIGPWTLTSGWGGPDAQLAALKSAGVTPAVHFYYWGDDISPTCIESGCYSTLHKAQKDQAGWELLGKQLTDHLTSKMGGAPVVVFLESEFNKNGVSTYEPFDEDLAAMAARIHAGYPNAVVVLGFGNWDSASWKTFDRAAAAADMVGVQGMRGSTRHTETQMYTLYDSLLAGAKTLGSTFPGKPILLTDIAVSSYPEPGYTTVQTGALQEVLDNLGTLRSLGVAGLVYRSWKDSPTMDTANYFGEAERHWGLAWAGNGTQKAAARLWVDAVQAERSGGGTSSPSPTASAAPATSSAAGTTTAASATTTTAAKTTTAASTTTATPAKAYTASFTQGPGANAYWVEVKVGASPQPVKVEAKAGDGAWKALRLRSSDAASSTWGESMAVAKGTPIQFRATAPDGQAATSATLAWLGSTATTTATASGTTATAAPAPTTTAAATTSATKSSTSTTTTAAAATASSSTRFTASFSPKAVGNDWWVETAVSGSKPVAKVEAKVGSTGSWTTLAKQDWGTYAKSVNAPNGTYVQFRAVASTGETATSATYVWG